MPTDDSLRVAVITASFPSVSEQFIINHVTALLDAGCRVQVVALRQGDWTGALATDKARILRPLTKSVGYRTDVRVLPRLVGAAFTMMLWRPRRFFLALSYQRYGRAAGVKNLLMYRALCRLRYDIIHCHFGPNGHIGAFLKDSGIAPRLVVSFHGSDIHSYPRKHGVDIYRYLFDRADAVICNTTFTAGKVREHGADRRSLRVIPVGFDTDMYQLRHYTPRSDRFVVLTVARLSEKKGHEFALRAMALLCGRISGLAYRMIGDGALRRQLEQLARDLSIQSICTFDGAQVGVQVAQAYRDCDIFVLPSVIAKNGDMEGQGLVLQEAQACGVPVIATRHNGLPDGVLEGVSGLLVPERDPAALAAAIERLYRQRDVLASMGAAGSEFVRGKYANAVVGARTIDVYRDVCRG